MHLQTTNNYTLFHFPFFILHSLSYSSLVLSSSLFSRPDSCVGISLILLSEKSLGCWSMYSGWFFSCESVSVGLGYDSGLSCLFLSWFIYDWFYVELYKIIKPLKGLNDLNSSKNHLLWSLWNYMPPWPLREPLLSLSLPLLLRPVFPVPELPPRPWSPPCKPEPWLEPIDPLCDPLVP